MNRSLLALLGLALVGCFEPPKDSVDTATDPEDSDTGPTYYDPEIDVVSYGYDVARWWYSVEMIGWADNVELGIHQYEGGYTWEEHHPLENTDYGADGSWDLWEITLDITDDWTAQQDGVNTLYEGNSDRESTLTWMITAYQGSDVADCVVWGKRQETFDSYGCREINFQEPGPTASG